MLYIFQMLCSHTKGCLFLCKNGGKLNLSYSANKLLEFEKHSTSRVSHMDKDSSVRNT